MLLFIIGPSASGKGTQAELFAEKFHVPHISIGELFRKEIESKTDIGNEIAPLVLAGKFVPGFLTDKILTGRLEESFKQAGGAVVDGFPRLYSQAIDIQHEVDAFKGYFRVIHYDLSYEACLQRQNDRIKQGGARADDDKLKMRYEEYLKDLPKILEFYESQQKLIEVDASDSVQEVFRMSCEKLYHHIREHG